MTDDLDDNGAPPLDVIAFMPEGPPPSIGDLADPEARQDTAAADRTRPIFDDGEWMRSRTPSDAIADEILAAVLPRDLLRRLLRGDPVALVVAVPGVDWLDPIADALETLAKTVVMFKRDGSRKTEHVPTQGNPAVANALADAISVIGVSQSPRAYLPGALIAAADATLAVSAPDGAALRRVLARCGHRPVPRTVPPAPCAGLSFGEIAAAFRRGATGREVLAALDRMRARKAAPTDDATPTLDRLPGLSGEARRWAERLAADWPRYRRGEIPFSALASAAMLYGEPGVGKTMLVRSLARTLGVPLHETSPGAWFTGHSDGHLGDVSQAFRRSWDSAMADARSGGAVWYLDEADGLPDRATLSNRAREWWSSLLSLVNTTLTQDRTGLIVVGSCNAGSSAAPSSSIDAAVRRRFGVGLTVGMPTPRDLAEVASFHLGGALSPDSLLPIVRLAPGASSATAATWARDALNVARDAGRGVTVDDVLAVAAPPEARPAAIVRRIAIHEAAHAVVALALGRGVDSVTVVETGSLGGHTRADPVGVAATADAIDRSVTYGLAGRAAEETILGDVSAGAEGDLAQATALVAAAYASAGLGATLVHRAPSAEAAALLNYDRDLRDAVERHLRSRYGDALALVARRRAAIERVADALVTRRLLTGEEVRAISYDPAGGLP